jgi:hypothetical protein
MLRGEGLAQTQPITQRQGADVPTLRADVARLEGELETLAAAFDRLWEDEAQQLDLVAGARLHDAIVAQLAQLEAAHAALAHGLIAGVEFPESPVTAR